MRGNFVPAKREERTRKRNNLKLNIATANARSVELKLPSLIDMFTESELHIVLLTETWIKTNCNYDRIKEDLVMNYGLDIFVYNRPGSRRGGGVAIVFNPKYVKLKENRFKREGAEVVSAEGNIIGDNRKLVLYSIYLPPNITKKSAERTFELIDEDITKAKTEKENAIIILGGDLNQFGIDRAFSDQVDIRTIDSPPTRENARLDLIATNLHEHVQRTYTCDPLQNEISVSDHKPLISEFVLPHAHAFTIIKYTTRKYTRKKEEEFITELNETSWDDLYAAPTSSAKTLILHNKVEQLMNKYFPLKEYSVRSTDDPWITDHYRKEERKRRLEYQRNGRSAKWHALKRENKSELYQLKKNFYGKECSKMTTPGAISYNALKHINTPSRPKAWNPMQLFCKATRKNALEQMAGFFNKLSEEFENLTDCYKHESFDRDRRIFSPSDVIKRVNAIKKPKSMVPGDIPPKLIVRAITGLASPVADIYNSIHNTGWPEL